MVLVKRLVLSTVLSCSALSICAAEFPVKPIRFIVPWGPGSGPDVTSRLVGGSRCQHPFITLEAKGLSEGFSDYFALTVLNYLDRSRGGQGALLTFGGGFKPGGVRTYAGFNKTWDARGHDQYSIGQVWCAGLLDGRDALVRLINDADSADRFMWQALIDCLKLVAPECRDSLDLSHTHAKDALMTATSALEVVELSFAGASARLANALSTRRI